MSRDFNNSNPDHINFSNPSYLNLTGNKMTASVWLRKHNSNGGNAFGRWGDTGQQWLIQLSSTSFLFALNVGGIEILNSSANVLTHNVWHNIVVCYDGSTMAIYVDGELDTTRSQSGNITSNTNSKLVIGANSSNTAGSGVNGELAHAAIWNGRCLSDNEIASLASGSNPLQMSDGLVFYNPINGQSPELDIVGGTTGTVTGTTVAAEPPIPSSIKAP